MRYLSGYIGCAIIFILLMGMIFKALVLPPIFARKKRFLDWLVIFFFGFGMLRGMAVKPGHGDALQGPRQSPTQQTAEPPGTSDGAAETNAPPRKLALAFSQIETSPSNVLLTVAWPCELYNYAPVFDLFIAHPELTNDWRWITSQGAAATDTNCLFTITPTLLGLSELPSALFARVTERNAACASMDDFDNDGVPNLYELHYRTNPYQNDSALITKLTVGADAAFQSLSAALQASEPYSIIHLQTNELVASRQIALPSHPVLIEGPRNGYTVIKSTADIGAFIFSSGQDSRTLIRNIYLDLLRRGSFQAGFWCGGNLPWEGIGTTPSFENVVVRTPRSETQYIGWLFYCNNGNSATLSNCVVNALGATNVRGVEIGNGPHIDLIDCSFLNFPSNGIPALSRTFPLGNDGTTNSIARQGDEATVFVDLTPGLDSDGDGYTNDYETRILGTDPWLDDTDGDGVTDAEEIRKGTDPTNVHSFQQTIFIHVRNNSDIANSTVYVSWQNEDGVDGSTPITNSTARSFDISIPRPETHGHIFIHAFQDMNQNGAFDANFDIELTKPVALFGEVFNLSFAFGDVDSDNISDLQERLDGTDPYSASSLRITRTVKLENQDIASGVTNYVSVGLTNEWREDEPFHRMPNQSETLPIATNAINGCVFVKCYRDFNRNGVFDADCEPLYVFSVKNQGNSSSTPLSAILGDKDKDGIPDHEEWDEATDINDPQRYCYSPRVTVTGIFSTTNQLLARAFFGTNALAAAHVVSTNQEEYYFGHLSTTKSEYLTIKYWDDLNNNLDLDDGEPSTIVTVRPNGHETSLVFDLPYSKFDANNNRLPDWWEVATGLAEQPRCAPTDDNDGDGLINLYEYWSGTDPLHPDGSNTLFSIFSRSVDDRIKGINPQNAIQLFVDYFTNGAQGQFIPNTNSWVKDIDFSCVAAWHSEDHPGSMTATAITRRHIIMSAHWYNPPYKFRLPNGSITNLDINGKFQIPNTDLLLGRLSADLPSSVTIPFILPPSYTNYISNGIYLPTVCINKEKDATILELDSLRTSVINGGIRYDNYAEVSRTNIVTTQRAVVRSLTSDGNSSTPVFLILGNRPVLLFAKHGAIVGNSDTWWTAWGPPLTLHVDQIQNQINAWENGCSSEYQLDILDLSDYPQLPRKK